MASYKVIQDIEAEDKLVGPLTLRQFIYAAIAAICLYITFLGITKHAPFLGFVFVPVAAVAGFFAFPWKRDQPTEIWALAKIRFYIKPRRRIWDQSGVKDLVTITAPKKIEENYTNGLSQTEVKSRLRALADTIDSRGWAVKNVTMNPYANTPMAATGDSERLLGVTSLPEEVPSTAVPSDDMLDDQGRVAHQFDAMLTKSTQERHQRLVQEVSNAQQQPKTATPAQKQQQNPQNQQASPQTSYWFMDDTSGTATHQMPQVILPGTDDNSVPNAPHAAEPTVEEKALAQKLKQQNQASQQISYGHLHVIQPISGSSPQPAQAGPGLIDYTTSTTMPPADPAPQATTKPQPTAEPPVTPKPDPAILDLAINDDLDVATIARQANKEIRKSPDEVEIRLH